MSKITTTIRCQHRDTGLSFQSSSSRESAEDGFLVNSIQIDSADETIDMSELVNPRNVNIRLMEGDDLLVGVEAGPPYPFLLSGAGDSMALRLNTDDINEKTVFMAEADSGGSLDGKHIALSEVGNARVWPWFAVGEKASGTLTYGSPSVETNASGTITFGALSGANFPARGRRAFAILAYNTASDVLPGYVPNLNFDHGDTITIGDMTYTYKTALTGLQNEILIDPGPSATDEQQVARMHACVQALIDAINGNNATRSITYSYDTPVHPKVKVVLEGGRWVIIAKDVGTSGNIAVSKSGCERVSFENMAWPYVDYDSENATPATALTNGLNGATVTINGNTFTSVEPSDYDAAKPEFTTLYELEDLIDGLSGVSASSSYLTITVSADASGLAGEANTLSGTGANLTVSGSGTLTGGKAATAYNVAGTTFTYNPTSPTTNQFSSITMLTSKINALANVDASDNGTVISIIASTPGSAGNSIVLTKLPDTAGSGNSVSGSGTLTGGSDGLSVPNATVADERLIKVPIEINYTADEVAAALAVALQADPSFSATAAGDVVTVTDANSGTRTAATEGDTNWDAPSITAGSPVTAVHVRSKGTSQVLINVVPN